MKPLGGYQIEPGCEINWSSHLAAGLVALIMPMDGHGKSFVNMVTGQRAEATRGTVSYTPGHWGLCAGNGGGGLRMPSFDINCYDSGASITLFGHMPSTWVAWERLASIGESPSARFLDIINDNGSSGIRIYTEARDNSSQSASPPFKIAENKAISVTASIDASERRAQQTIAYTRVASSAQLIGSLTIARVATPGGMCDGTAGHFEWSCFVTHNNDVSMENANQMQSLGVQGVLSHRIFHLN